MDSNMRDYHGVQFQRICQIIPDHDNKGLIIEHAPQPRYAKRDVVKLNRYGSGVFCNFRISKKEKNRVGVYIICINDNPVYVGKCKDFEKRFNAGYGSIQPRNCYRKGQETNCRVNKLILGACKKQSNVEIWFHETSDREKIERDLIAKIRPEWNLK